MMANWAWCAGGNGRGSVPTGRGSVKGGSTYLPVLIFAGEAPLRSLRELCKLSFLRGVFGDEVAAGILGRGQRLQQIIK